jgi:hypothetical protein
MSTVEINRDVKIQAKGLIDKGNNYSISQSVLLGASPCPADTPAAGSTSRLLDPVPKLNPTRSGNLSGPPKMRPHEQEGRFVAPRLGLALGRDSKGESES